MLFRSDPVAIANYILAVQGPGTVFWLPCHTWSDYATYRQYLATGLFHWIGFFPEVKIGTYDTLVRTEVQVQKAVHSAPVQLHCVDRAREREIFARNYLAQNDFPDIPTEQKLWVLEYVCSRQYEQLRETDSAMYVTLSTRVAQFLIRNRWDYATLLRSLEG